MYNRPLDRYGFLQNDYPIHKEKPEINPIYIPKKSMKIKNKIKNKKGKKGKKGGRR